MRLIRLLPFASALAVAPLATAQYSDDFETYAAGSGIEGQGDWEHWNGGVSAVQHNHVVDMAMTGIAPFSGTKMLEVVGEPVGHSIDSDLVSTLNGGVLPGMGPNTFSIQTYTPSSFVGQMYIILMHDWAGGGGPYNWAFQGRIDQTTYDFVGNMGNTAFVNGGAPTIFDQWVEARVQYDTSNNTGSIHYGATHMYDILDWSALVSGGGQQALEAVDLYPGTNDTTEVYFDGVSNTPGWPGVPIGSSVPCTTNANSTGLSGDIEAYGSVLVTDNDVELVCTQLPLNAFGYFNTSTATGFVANPGGSAGNLCLAGQIGRFVGPGQVQNTGSLGEISLQIDLTNHPQPTGLVSVQSGQTWYFQCWHRDAVGGSATSNFSDVTGIAFL